jgi:hypothetical protein
VTTLDQYRQAKGSIGQLEAAAKKELTAKFHSLATEIFAVQKELREEFGIKLSIPKKPPAKTRQPRSKPVEIKELEPTIESSPKIKKLERILATQRKRLEFDKAHGKNVKPVQDRIYELEDELRLEREKGS